MMMTSMVMLSPMGKADACWWAMITVSWLLMMAAVVGAVALTAEASTPNAITSMFLQWRDSLHTTRNYTNYFQCFYVSMENFVNAANKKREENKYNLVIIKASNRT